MIYKLGVFLYKAMNNLLPVVFTNCFMINSNIHSHDTRSSSNIHVVGCSLNVRRASIKCHGTSVWNILPLAVRLSTTFTIFKRRLKTVLIIEYSGVTFISMLIDSIVI